MNTTFKKWKFKQIKKVFISEKKIRSLLKTSNIVVLDTRGSIDFETKHFKKSKNISALKIKDEILKYSKKSPIILVGKELRTNATTASWARYMGYSRVYLPKMSLANIEDKKLLVRKRK